jgi:hypothetical protein
MRGGPDPGNFSADSTSPSMQAKNEPSSNERSPAALRPSDSGTDDSEQHATGDVGSASKRGFRFWAVIAGLCIANFQASLENSVVVTSGPKIVEDLQMGEEYIWITNAFFVCWYVYTECDSTDACVNRLIVQLFNLCLANYATSLVGGGLCCRPLCYLPWEAAYAVAHPAVGC